MRQRLYAAATAAVLLGGSAAACNALTGVGDFSFEASAGAGGGGATTSSQRASSSTTGSGGAAPHECTDSASCPTPPPCHTKACVRGACAPSPVARGEACKDGANDGVCEAAGRCVECNGAEDCPAAVCATATCTSNACSAPFSDPGTPCNTEGGSVCDGSGACVECVEDSACPGTICLAPKCSTAGVCKTKNTASGVACGAGVTTCDGTGRCVGCAVDADCQTGNDCQSSACVKQSDGTMACIDTPKAAETACIGGNVVGVCDGNGLCVPCIVDADCGTATDCVSYACKAGACSSAVRAAGTHCGGTGAALTCDGNGSCVECNVDADCQVGVCDEQAHTCATQCVMDTDCTSPLTCKNGVCTSTP